MRSNSKILIIIVFLTAFHYRLALAWTGLSFDSESFMCEKFEYFCENVLDGIGCDKDGKIIIGCPGYPAKADVQNWKGQCECHSPLVYKDPSTRVTQQMISNRISPEMAWILEPYATGPPYDLKLTYSKVCNLFLDRINCPAPNRTVIAKDFVSVGGVQSDGLTCKCGLLAEPSKLLGRIIMDKINDNLLRSTPIFSNPVYLSVPMSICIILIVGKIGAILATYIKLPAIVGFILAGVGIQNFLNPMFLRGAGYPFPSPASELRVVALVQIITS
jgi:hypothetical protein